MPAGVNQRRWAPMDAQTRFCEDKAITASGAIQAASADVIVAVGPGRKEGTWVVNVTAIDIASGDENYIFSLQATNDANFTTAANVVELARLRTGKGSTFLPNTAVRDVGVGRYEVPFTNEQAGETFKNTRVYVTVAGTTPTVTVDSWLSIED
jgi:hypothetical protein